jgi:hypothetical protein
MSLQNNFVSQDHIDQYQRDGAVCIRQLLNQEEIALLREGIEYNLKYQSARKNCQQEN